MSQKRQQEDGKARSEGNFSEDKRRKLKNVVQDVMRMQSLQRYLEPLIRRVVKEEVESALKRHLSSIKQNSRKEMCTTESRSLQLHFLNNLSLPVFTGARIEGEDCFAIKVALVDASTGKIVSTGPESSAKVEIAVLEGDFDGDDNNIWTREEFISNIVREREGKKPLLTGDAFLNLKEGIGFIGEISFTDNSSWTRSRRFRLGARVVDNFDGTIVREAKTESFIVRDHRGELYKKHHPPSLLDEVWRLEKIGKDGAFHRRLSRENIKTVKDFLTLLVINPPRLRHILGTGMSAKMWEVTIEHAQTCVLDKKIYMYSPHGSPQKTGVVFNIVGQLLGLLSECQYIPTEKLSETERVDAQNLVIAAFEHWEGVVSFDDESSLTGGISQLSNVLLSSSITTTEKSNASTLLASYRTGGFDYAQPDPASPDIMPSTYPVGSASGLDDYALHGIQNIDLKYDQTLSFGGQLPNSLICDIESINQSFCDGDHLQFFDTDLQTQNVSLESEADLQSALDSFLSRATICKAQTRWTKISSVLKWFSIRKLVALKRSRVRETPR
ncbi:calmodulin-binding protein 60 A-like [Tripterygium wilfordii]|uniref:calmodulin-binding protein 60 A-like n=1 Tax=Tripterygium wilfordii TaxID=458696 RepID=UPI0018F7F1C7|nr:calmodulin-binding protein 60 A-like [Tripterygium wilfordii]